MDTEQNLESSKVIRENPMNEYVRIVTSEIMAAIEKEMQKPIEEES